MNAVLTLADYHQPFWSEIELSEQFSSHRAFWAATLLFATADAADEVRFDLELGDGCLALAIGDELHDMVPPPLEYREDLLISGRQLAAGGTLRNLLCYFRRTWNKTDYLGEIRLQFSERASQWSVHDLPNGLRLVRVT